MQCVNHDFEPPLAGPPHQTRSADPPSLARVVAHGLPVISTHSAMRWLSLMDVLIHPGFWRQRRSFGRGARRLSKSCVHGAALEPGAQRGKMIARRQFRRLLGGHHPSSFLSGVSFVSCKPIA